MHSDAQTDGLPSRGRGLPWRGRLWAQRCLVAFWCLGAGLALAQHVAPEHVDLAGNRPYGLALDGQGRAYISLYGSGAVVQVSPDGQVQRWGNTGNQPMALVADEQGQVFVVNYADNSVSRLGPQGTQNHWAKTGRGPTGIAWGPDQKTLYVTDSRSDTVTRIGPDGQSSTLGRTGRMPAGIAVDAKGNVYTADYLSSTVTKITPEGQSQTLASTGLNPFGLALDAAGNVYTANHGASTVTKISPQGQSRTWAKTGLHPWGIVVAKDGTVFTSDYAGHTVTRIAPDGVSQVWGSVGQQPMSIALDAQGRIWTVNHASHSLTRLASVAPPGAPRRLRAAWSPEATLVLQWEAPMVLGSSPITDYVVEHRMGRSGPWRVVEDGESSDTEVGIPGLALSTYHEFRVSARSWVGQGALSDIVGIQAPAAGPTTAAQAWRQAAVAATPPAAPVPAALPPRPSAPSPAATPMAASAGAEQKPAAVPAPAPVSAARLGTCPSAMTQIIRPGAANPADEVNRLIGFLSVQEGEPLLMDGSYDEDDIQAVKRFQLKYRAEILTPWGIAHPTGLVSRMTIDKINALQCGKR